MNALLQFLATIIDRTPWMALGWAIVFTGFLLAIRWAARDPRADDETRSP